MKQFVRIAPEVRDALASGRPVVALETAAVTHGLPREPLSALPAYLTDSETPAEIRACFGPKVPAHRALGHAMAAAVTVYATMDADVQGRVQGRYWRAENSLRSISSSTYSAD
ncbi:MAG: pseudouridine-5'-phosphate glycosidase, partial [Planctomycetota bacterium]